MHMHIGMILLSHYIYFFIEWVLVYVFVRCCVVQEVYACFSQMEHIAKCQSSTHRVMVGPNLPTLLYQVQHVIS